ELFGVHGMILSFVLGDLGASATGGWNKIPVAYASGSLKKSIQDHEWGDLCGSVLQRDGFVEPGLAIDALHHAPGHLVLQEIDMLADGDLDLHPVADDVQRRVNKHEVALGAERRQFFRAERRQAEQRPVGPFGRTLVDADKDRPVGAVLQLQELWNDR